MDKEYLVFRQRQERTNEVVFTSEKRAAEIEQEENATLIEWQPVDGDRVASNYASDGSYSPPPPYEPTYRELREAKFLTMKIGDQFDALYKYAVANGLVPDRNAPLNTPEGWAGFIESVKEEFPKPE